MIPLYLFFFSAIRNHIFLYVAMVTGPVERNWYSVVTEAQIPAGPGGLQTWSNSCLRRGCACSRICLPALCLCPSSPPTTLNVRFHLRTASTFVTLWRTSANAPATGWFTQRAEGLNCAALKMGSVMLQ